MFQISDNEFELLRDFLYTKTGISLSVNKKILMFNRLHKRIKLLDCGTFKNYYNYMRSGEDGETELENFIDAITTNETYFFRDNEQFDFLSQKIFPELIKKKRALKEWNINIWSAACSTGEEPYTLAITALETLKRQLDFKNWKLNIYASDINRTVLKSAKKAVYDKEKLRKTERIIIKKYFTNVSDKKYAIKSSLKESLIFSHHNLKNNFVASKFDIIFCRNVMIYFDKESKSKVVTNLYNVLCNQGYLFLSYSENLINDNRFEMAAPSIFKKKLLIKK